MIFSRAGSSGDTPANNLRDRSSTTEDDVDTGQESSVSDMLSSIFPNGYVLEELRRLSSENRTGTLELSGAEGARVVVHLFEGAIDAVSSNADSRRLGAYLGRVRKLSEKDLAAISAYATRRSLPFGEAAVDRGMASAGEVSSAVRTQAIDLIEWAIQGNFNVGAFHSQLQAFRIPGRVGFQEIEIELARQRSASFDVPEDVPVRVVDGVDLAAFPWIPEELGVLAALAQPRTIDELHASMRLEARALRKILGVLDALGLIEIDGKALELPAGAGEDEETGTSANAAIVPVRAFPFEHLIPTVTSTGFDERLEAARDTSGFTAEQFKTLKVRLAEYESASRKVFTVSSPEPRDGKSFVSVNLALSYAMDPDRRVLLIDCDLRNPAIGRYLGVGEEPGLLQYLEDSQLSPFCYLRKIEGLYFMTAGGLTPRPIEVLSMGKMRELLERFKAVFDTVILDAPPYSPIADARVVTGLSDGLIMVVRRGKTGYGSADRAFNAIDRKKLVGVVLNDVKPMLFNSYGYGGYGYGSYEYGSSNTLTILPADNRRSRKYLD